MVANAIRIAIWSTFSKRSEGGTAPKPIPAPENLANLVLWLDATSINQADKTNVAEWKDLSVSGFHVSQPTLDAQPKLLHGQLNGKQVVRFDGLNDWLGSQLNTLQPTAERTIIIVNRHVGAHTGVRRAMFETKPSWYGGGVDINATNTLGGYVGISGPQAIDSQVYPINVPVISELWFKENDTRRIYLNNRLASQTALVLVDKTNQSGFNVGTYRDANGRFFFGDMAELLVYDRAIDDGERSYLYAYLQEKWGIN
jgi:hypothetical protein